MKNQRYQALWDSIDVDKKVTAATLRCDVASEGDANKIAPEFSGEYMSVKYHETIEGQAESSTKLAWLQEFNVFVPLAMQVGDKPESSVKLDNVSVTR